MRRVEVVMTLASVVLIGFGQVLFKIAARDVVIDGPAWPTATSWASPAMLGALGVSTFATAHWVLVLRTAALGLVYPLYALTFVLVLVLDTVFFYATLTARHWAGVRSARLN